MGLLSGRTLYSACDTVLSIDFFEMSRKRADIDRMSMCILESILSSSCNEIARESVRTEPRGLKIPLLLSSACSSNALSSKDSSHILFSIKYSPSLFMEKPYQAAFFKPAFFSALMILLFVRDTVFFTRK